MEGKELPLWTLTIDGLPEVEHDKASATERLVGRLVCSSCGDPRCTGIYFPRHALALCRNCYETMDAHYKTILGGPEKL